MHLIVYDKTSIYTTSIGHWPPLTWTALHTFQVFINCMLCTVAKRYILQQKWTSDYKLPRKNKIQQLSTPYTEPTCPKNMAQNKRTEVMHQNKETSKADFHL